MSKLTESIYDYRPSREEPRAIDKREYTDYVCKRQIKNLRKGSR